MSPGICNSMLSSLPASASASGVPFTRVKGSKLHKDTAHGQRTAKQIINLDTKQSYCSCFHLLRSMTSFLSGITRYSRLESPFTDQHAILAQQARMPVDNKLLDDPHVKASCCFRHEVSAGPKHTYTSSDGGCCCQWRMAQNDHSDCATPADDYAGTWSDHRHRAFAFAVHAVRALYASVQVHEVIQAWNFLPRIDPSWRVRDQRLSEGDKFMSFALDIEVTSKSSTRSFLPQYSKADVEIYLLESRKQTRGSIRLVCGSRKRDGGSL
ncbi:hypothetical protein SELMODRAFT_410615 [Selaginella moellendorffii]|uniref:Uncharacterized protein n=1 Tax=Selaginella moellendorffii TaxID=88036 RepID=D8RFA8_SELML|nr:hypothetical protein SELMODRAFT_410615 [Selaginella moellendorffii]